MFTHNLTTTKHFTSKRDGQDAYEDFLLKIGLSISEYPFEEKKEDKRRTRPLILRASSWGSYINASNEWRIFIAHIDMKTRLTRFVSWAWDKEQQSLTEMKVQSWIP